jgi:hypothetical protein
MYRVRDIHDEQYYALSRQAEASPLQFRDSARNAYQNFSPALRLRARQLETVSLTAAEFYRQWREIVLPDLHTIAEATQVKSLIRSLKKYLILTEDEAAQLVVDLVGSRAEEVKRAFVERSFAPDEKKARRAAYAFLAQSEAEAIQEREAYVAYALHKEVAKNADMVIYDRWSRIFGRMAQRSRERRQVRRYRKGVEARLKLLETERLALEVQDGGLIAEVVTMNIQLAALYKNFSSYEKAVDALKGTAKDTPVKRLALYEKEIRAIKTRQLNMMTDMHSLKDIQRASEALDGLFTRLFDLSKKQRNELMTNLKRYREAVQERNQLRRLLETVMK